jgi:phosphate:Na+ symporter
MDLTHTVGSTLGGLGIFLIGIMLVSSGLRLAAGRALRHILAQWTRTRIRGLFSGALITALVQSSSAVTAATIGFVNAGLLNLTQSLGVIYGTNIGTTMTGWLVAAIGFRFKIEFFALPLIGIGAFMKLIWSERRLGAFGEALAGFGLFFVGIDILKTAFEGIAATIDITQMGLEGPLTSLAFVGIGTLLTVLMQSSSAAIAITLTAAASGLVPLQQAAAVVIGANVGTTSTALIASIGATSNARRTAAAHVIFNIVTALVAVMILPLMLWSTVETRDFFKIAPHPATDLALFHTAFNVLGALLMWPLTPRLAQFLEKRFRTAEEDEATPRFLDSTVTHTPTLAQNALIMELKRMGEICTRIGKSALSSEIAKGKSLSSDKRAMESLELSIADFVANMDRAILPADISDFLPQTVRVSQYYGNSASIAAAIADANIHMEVPLDDDTLHAMHKLKHDVVEMISMLDPNADNFDPASVHEQMPGFRQQYQAFKANLLDAGSRHRIPVIEMVALLDQISRIRRILEQLEKAAQYLKRLQMEIGLQDGPHNTPEESEKEKVA